MQEMRGGEQEEEAFMQAEEAEVMLCLRFPYFPPSEGLQSDLSQVIRDASQIRDNIFEHYAGQN